MKKIVRIGIILGLILIAGITGAILGSLYSEDQINEQAKGKKADDSVILFILKNILTMINIVLSSILIVLYVDTYRNIKSDFTLGLIVVMFSLLIYAVTSNPMIHLIFGYRGYGMGPFIIIPDIFFSISLGILIYLSLK